MTIAAPTPSHTHLRASRRFGLDQERDQDGDDDGGLEAFAHADQPLPNSCEVTLGPAARSDTETSPTAVMLLSLLRNALPSVG